MTQEQKWLSYVAELRSKHEKELSDKDFTIAKLQSIIEATEIRANLSARLHHELRERLKEVLNSYESI